MSGMEEVIKYYSTKTISIFRWVPLLGRLGRRILLTFAFSREIYHASSDTSLFLLGPGAFTANGHGANLLSELGEMFRRRLRYMSGGGEDGIDSMLKHGAGVVGRGGTLSAVRPTSFVDET